MQLPREGCVIVVINLVDSDFVCNVASDIAVVGINSHHSWLMGRICCNPINVST